MTDYVEGSMTLDKQSATSGTPHERVPEEHMSLGETLHRVTGAVRETVDAELTLARVRLSLVGSAAKWIAILGIVAFITAFGMVVTLMIGAILALAPLWGLGLAILSVTGAALLAILLCGWGISAQFARIRRVVP